MMRLATVLCLVSLQMLPLSAFGQEKKARGTAQISQSCVSCHQQDPAQILPKGHKPVKPVSIVSCTVCHKPDLSGKAEAKPFSARIHKPHVASGECTFCHTWAVGKEFALKGAKGGLGKMTKADMTLVRKTFESWAGSKYMDALHGKGNIVCFACHEGRLPEKGDTVENERCLACHGSLDALAARSAPKDLPDRNPHKSHLGDIACATCHKAHQPSTAYCLGCHKKFEMKIPGG